jgi:carbon-monoxide dehydrogenase catalytic subunit
MSEKAISIATYCAASGAYVIMGIKNPVEGSEAVTDLLSRGWEAKVGGKIEFVVEPEEMLRRALDHIDKKRAALGLPAYEPGKFGRSGDARMREIDMLEPAQRAEALYGVPAGS